MNLETKSREKSDSIQESSEKLFEWTKQWYPVAVADFLDSKKPHSIQLLGKELVLWRDKNNNWHCWDNFCPHRGVPLSEGRIEDDGTLLCAYHAWRFNEEGKCVKIPQSFDQETEAKNINRPQACAKVYPTQVAQGLIWVWGESGLQSLEDSKLRKPRLIPELEDDSGKATQSPWNIRDLPYGWDYFMENVADPGHVSVSHHGFIGSRYDAKYYDMIPVRKFSTQEGFSFSVIPVENIQEAVHDFQPPSHMRISSINQDGGKLILALYAIPTRPGWCRHIGCQVFVKDEKGKLPGGLSFFGSSLPVWLTHVLASLFLHQDLVFLHYQEKFLARKAPQKYINLVYTPNPQDKMVITFRKWFVEKAGGVIPWSGNPELPPAEMDKDKLFDVWTTHTKDCQVCQTALKRIKFAINLSYILAGICFLSGIMMDTRIGTTVPHWSVWLLIIFGTLLAFGGYSLKRFSKLFYVYKFEHSEND